MANWFILGVLAAGSIATMTAATIVNVALPAVIGALGLGQDEAQWLSTAFLASSTGAMLFNTWAMARWGMRAGFAFAMATFTAGSLAGFVAQDLSLLIAGRMMQGAGAGLIQPMAMLVIYSRFPERARGLALGLYSLCVIVSPAFGPVLGGALIDAHDWRVVMVATTPLAVLAGAAGWRMLPRRDEDAPSLALDWLGLVLVMASLALALQGLAHGAREGWDDAGVQARLTAAAAAAIAFLIWEARHPAPVLELRLFRQPGFCAGGLAILLTGTAVYGSTWLAPLFLQQVQHYSPAGAGEILLPAGLAMAVCFPLAGRLTDRVPLGLLLAGGGATFAWGMGLLAEAGMQTEGAAIALALVLARAGIGLMMPAAHACAMRQAGGRLGAAAPAATFLSQTGGALGVAVLSALLAQRTVFHGDALLPVVNVSAFHVEVGIEEVSRAVWSTALMLAFRDCFMVTALAGLALLPVAVLSGDRTNFTDRLKRALTLFR